MADILEIVSKEAIQGILDAGKGIVNLDENLLRLQKNIAGYKTQLDAVNNSNDSLNQKSGEYAKLVNKAADNNNKLVMSAKALEGQQKQLTQTEAKLSVAHSQTNIKLQEQKIKLNEANKALREKLKTGQAEEGSLVRMRQRLRELTEAYDNSGKRTKASAKEINKLSTEIEIAENETNRFQRGVGGYAHQMKGMVSGLATGTVSMKQFGRAAAGAGKAMMTMLLSPVGLIIAAVGALGLVIGKAIKQAEEYQATNAELAGVLGITREETKGLQKESQKLGATTAFTANEVASLQIEYARLGFSQREIVNVTEATINLSIAAKASADETAAFVGSTIRGFGLTSEEAGRVADVASKAFSKSALDFGKLQQGLGTVAPAARAFGDSMESTISKLGKLADAGIDASTAGTSLRNIYLELAKKGMTYDQAMAQIAGSQDKLTAANDLFGKRGAVAAIVLSNEADAVRELNAVLDDSIGTAKNVADEQLNTMQGSKKLLASAWSGLLFAFEDGEGIFSAVFKKIIDYSTQVITVITKIIQTVSMGFAFIRKVFSDINSRFEGSGQAIDNLKEKIQPLIDRITDFGNRVKELVMDKLEPLINIINKVKDGVNSLFNKKDAEGNAKGLGKALDWVKKKAGQGKDYVTKFVDEYKEGAAIAEAEKKAKKAIDANQDAVITSMQEQEQARKALAAARESMANAEREREQQRLLMSLKTEDEKYEAEKAYINESISLLQNKLNTHSLNELEKLAISEEINKEMFNLDKLAHDNSVRLEKEKTKLVSEEDKKLAKAKAERGKIAYQQQVMLIRANAKDEQDFARQKFDLDKQILQSTIDANRELLENSELVGAARMEIENQLASQQLELDNLVFENKMTLAEKQAEKEKEQAEKQKEVIESIKNASIDTANEIFNFRGALLDREMTLLEQKNEQGLLSEQEYAKKKAEIERKQAKTARAQALFGIAINTAQAVSKIWAEVPKADFGIMTAVLTGLAIANGALQAGAVLSQPLPAVPAFAEGTHGLFNTPSTFLAGEDGTEIVEKNGKSVLVDKPTIFTNLKGARVRSNPETEYIMNWREQGGVQGSKYDAMLYSEMKGLRKDIKRMPQPIIQDGRKVGIKQNNNTTKILNLYKYGRS